MRLVLDCASLKSFQEPMGCLLCGSGLRMGVIGRAFSGRREGQAPWCRRAGGADLVHQAAEMRLFHRAKATGTVLGRKAPGVDGVADEGAVGIAAIGLQL